MQVLVTGGAGFIGSHLADGLIKQGHDVILIDNLQTGSKANVNPRALFYRMDITDRAGLTQVFARNEIQAVFHLASRISVRESMVEPVDYADVNVTASLALIELAKAAQVESFVFTSTGGAIYGEGQQADNSARAFTEEDPARPRSHYAVNKLAVENHLQIYAETYGFPSLALRFANVYGPRQNPQGYAGVISIFAQAMTRGEEVEIYGDGSQARDFCYVSDIVEACLTALKLRSTGVYNIGSGQPTSITQIFRTMAALAKYHRSPKHVERPQGEVNMSCLNSAKAQRDWGWTLRVDLEQGLTNVLQSFKQA